MMFTKNINYNVPLFFNSISSFFELPMKIQDKMKKLDYESCLTSLIMQSNRAWAVAVFRFLDQNRDGEVDSTDIFKFYNYLDDLKNKN